VFIEVALLAASIVAFFTVKFVENFREFIISKSFHSPYIMETHFSPKSFPPKMIKSFQSQINSCKIGFRCIMQRSGFFTYSEKLIGSLFKIGQGKSMSIFPKRA
jgi:hypothetical protein